MSTGQLTLATAEKVADILAYLKKDVGNCLYMYIDIKKYGIDHPEMNVWYKKTASGDIILVVMKYYNSISFYSRSETWAKEDVIALIEEFSPASISAPFDLAEAVSGGLSQYEFHSGWIYEHKHYREFDVDYIETAKTSDLLPVAKLLCIDDGFGHIYQVDNLCRQLTERQAEGMGRNLVIRDEMGEVIAHIATYAECDGIAITSGLIVHPDHRKSIYGTALECHLVKELFSENFRAFTFVVEKKRKRLLDAFKNECLGQYGRLSLKTEL